LPPHASTAHTVGVPTPDTPPTAVADAVFTVPADVVWGYRLDFANLPEYNPDVSGVQRVRDGDAGGVGGVHGPGARYAFTLADPLQPGEGHPVELWIVEAAQPTLVAAGMKGGSEAYEEFVVRSRDDGGCNATLTLWLTLPDGIDADMAAAAATGSLEQIRKEVRLMKEVLEARAGGPSAR
jgi:Polyketide cyclase / dehydrase and lipid transport